MGANFYSEMTEKVKEGNDIGFLCQMLENPQPSQQDWKFFHSLSREKKMSKMSKRQFLTCNSWLAILDLQFLTKRLLNLCATGRHKMCHSTAQKDLCATGRHKMCHRMAQNVPQHGTKRLMCHGKAQNVP
jgi:hypothetical protein